MGAVAGAGDMIVMSRLLVMQSKRILLSSAERALGERDHQDLRERVDRLRGETSAAHENYRKAVLAWGPTDSGQFYSVAFAGSVAAVQQLADRLSETSREFPLEERIEFAADIACLEQIVARWRKQILSPLEPAA